jgi:hypothetical protein
MTTLKTTLEALLLAKGQELADTLADDSRTAVATVSYAMGMQTALELSQLSPEVARQLINEIHARQVADADGTDEEFNQTALEFLSVYHLD